VQLVNIILN